LDGSVTPTFGELALRPLDDEVVYFVDFHELRLDLTVHPFMRGLLYFYDLHLHDLTLDSILHIMTFIALCEAFLGIEPHFVLWKWGPLEALSLCWGC
jgi:hypothetical protein